MSAAERITIPAETTVGIVALLIGFATMNALPVGGFYDDGLYAILAKSLATGQGYHFLNIPGSPAAVHYPPGYPLLLAVFWKLGPAFPANLIWFKLLNVVLLGVVAWAACRYAVRILDLTPWVAVLAALLGTVTIPPLVLANLLVSEPLFMALLIPALILLEEATRRAPARGDALRLGALSGVVVLVRSAGAMLIVAVALVWMVRRARRAAAWYLAAAAVVLAPWLVWSAVHAHDVAPVLQGAYGSYSGWFMGGLHTGGLPFVVATLRVNAARLAAGVATSFSLFPTAAMALITMLALAAMFIGGAWRRRGRAPVTLVFLACYFALVLVWPDQPLRFAWAVWPLLMAFLVTPLEVLQRRSGSRILPVGVAVAALVLAAGAVRYNARGDRGGWWASIPRGMGDRAQPAIQWTRLHTRPSDVIAAESEPMIYLYAGRQAVPVATFTALQYLRPRTLQENAQALQAILRASHARYVLVQSPDELEAVRALAAMPGAGPSLVLADSTGGLYAFAVGSAPPDSTRH